MSSSLSPPPCRPAPPPPPPPPPPPSLRETCHIVSVLLLLCLLCAALLCCCAALLPVLCQWWDTHAPRLPLPFVDVFCEDKAFDLQQSRQILTVARSLGFPLKIHADEFDNLGGASLALS